MHMEMLRKFVTLFLTLGASIMMLSPLYNVTFAAKETEGVYDTVGTAANEIMTKVGVKSTSKGVKIEINDGVVDVDLALIMQYGYNIPTTCKNVQEKVIADRK